VILSTDITSLLAKLKESPAVILLGLVVVLLSALITITGGLSVLNTFYRSTVAYKRTLRRALARLSVHVHINYVRDILGSPALVNPRQDKCEYVFIKKYFYVQAIADTADRVLAFSVTTRSYRFNPSVRLGSYNLTFKMLHVRLGKTPFSALDSLGYKPRSVFSEYAARRYSYYEEYYFGNPGNYLTYVFCVNNAGCAPWPRFGRWDTFPNGPRFPAFPNGGNNIEDPEAVAFRRKAVINTYTVMAGDLVDLLQQGFSLGPEYDQVRILDPQKTPGYIERRRRRKMMEAGPAEFLKRVQKARSRSEGLGRRSGSNEVK
jgi:hypothetical protein